MYNILGIMKGLNDNAKQSTQLNEGVKQPTVYEPVEARGNIMEAVKSLESKFETFKLAEGAKPDFLDVDKDGNKKEPFKKAVKDKKAVEEAVRIQGSADYDGKMAAPKNQRERDEFAARAKHERSKNRNDMSTSANRQGLKSVQNPDKPWGTYHDLKATNVEEGQGPYELYNPKHPKFKANYDKWMAKNPGKTLSDFIEAMKKREHGVNEGIDDLTDLDAHQFAEPDTDTAVKPASAKQAAADRRRRLQDIEDRKAEKDDWFSSKDAEPNVRIHRAKYQDDPEELDEYTQAEYDQAMGDFKSKGGRAQQLPLGKAKNPISTASRHIGGRGEIAGGKKTGKAAQAVSSKAVVDVYEKAPPGAKAERMVKHIKQGYAKDGALTKREKGIAYATAWKAKKAGQVEEGVEFGDTVKNSTPTWKKAKPAKLKEGRDMSKSQYFDENVAQALANEKPGMDVNSPAFNEAVYNEIIAQGMTSKAARNIMLTDEDFLGDVATGYNYFCKHNSEVAECDAPMNSHLGGVKELDEIAKLAGLPTKESTCEGCGMLESSCSCMHEEDDLLPDPPAEINIDMKSLPKPEMEEGNEFSGALAAAKASGQKEFEVGGKKYAIKEDATISVTATLEDDALNLMRKLAGMTEKESEVVAVEPDAEFIDADDVGLEEERDIEYTNSPREITAGVDAAVPSGTDLNRAKRQYKKEYPGDNPMAVKETVEDTLWKKYSGMLKSLIIK